MGWNVQYAGAVEPQRRLAPHAHFAIRGTIARDLIRRVAAATYHQVWWPAARMPSYTPNRLPVWDEERETWLDPDTETALSTWDQALDVLDGDPDAEPAHVARLGTQVMAQGLLAGSPQANRRVGYITKYLTKHAADCHRAETGRQRTHLERLWQELRHTPCTPRCPNWLLYGVQPKDAHARMRPGFCRGKVHQRATLGIGGRRVLVSRNWSGKTLADHKYDARAWVRQLLGLTPGHETDTDEQEQSASRYAWEKVKPTDPDVSPLGHRLLRTISEKIQNRNARAQAEMYSRTPEREPNVSATPSAQTTTSAAPARDRTRDRVGRGVSPGGRRVGAGGKAHTDPTRTSTADDCKGTVPATADRDEGGGRKRKADGATRPAVLTDAMVGALAAEAPELTDEQRTELRRLLTARDV